MEQYVYSSTLGHVCVFFPCNDTSMNIMYTKG